MTEFYLDWMWLDSLVFAIDYLKSVQKENLAAVNEALNEVLKKNI